MNTYNVDKQVGDEVLRQLKLRPGQVIDGWGACPILREVFRERRGGAGKQSVPLPPLPPIFHSPGEVIFYGRIFHI